MLGAMSQCGCLFRFAKADSLIVLMCEGLILEMKAIAWTSYFDSNMYLARSSWWETPLPHVQGLGSQHGTHSSCVGESRTPHYHMDCNHGQTSSFCSQETSWNPTWFWWLASPIFSTHSYPTISWPCVAVWLVALSLWFLPHITVRNNPECKPIAVQSVICSSLPVFSQPKAKDHLL